MIKTVPAVTRGWFAGCEFSCAHRTGIVTLRQSCCGNAYTGNRIDDDRVIRIIGIPQTFPKRDLDSCIEKATIEGYQLRVIVQK